MFFWQRREVLVTLSNSEFTKARDLLSSNNIKYDFKVSSLLRPNQRNRFTSTGLRWDSSNTYYIYVKQADVEKAKHILGK